MDLVTKQLLHFTTAMKPYAVNLLQSEDPNDIRKDERYIANFSLPSPPPFSNPRSNEDAQKRISFSDKSPTKSSQQHISLQRKFSPVLIGDTVTGTTPSISPAAPDRMSNLQWNRSADQESEPGDTLLGSTESLNETVSSAKPNPLSNATRQRKCLSHFFHAFYLVSKLTLSALSLPGKCC